MSAIFDNALVGLMQIAAGKLLLKDSSKIESVLYGQDLSEVTQKFSISHLSTVWVIAVTLAIATTGPISGAHLNPAVTLAMTVLRPSPTFGIGKVGVYIVAQLMGAIAGSLVNLVMYYEKILRFESSSNIIRGTAASVASAKAFGEYFV